MKESKFKNGYCQKCLIRERQNVFIKNDSDSLCYKCYKLSKFCVVCYTNFCTNGDLCYQCLYKWRNRKLEKCPFCNEDNCGTRKGDPIHYCSNNSKYGSSPELNSLLNFIYSHSLKYSKKK